ncbi:RsmD family RNA methyltransferase [Oerskovia sp. M15]
MAGTVGGRSLQVPQGDPPHERPGARGDLLPARALRGPRGAYVLDLYAGSGALGLEAASRAPSGSCWWTPPAVPRRSAGPT